MISEHGLRSQKSISQKSLSISQTKKEMADQVVMREAIMKAEAEATRIMIQTMADMQPQRTASQPGPKLGGPVLKQPQFNWEAADKYTEWKAFILEVRNMLSTYNAQELEKIKIVKNWLGRKGYII